MYMGGLNGRTYVSQICFNDGYDNGDDNAGDDCDNGNVDYDDVDNVYISCLFISTGCLW